MCPPYTRTAAPDGGCSGDTLLVAVLVLLAAAIRQLLCMSTICIVNIFGAERPSTSCTVH